MVVQFVPHGDLLFSELCQPLPVDLDTTRDSRSWHLLLEEVGEDEKNTGRSLLWQHHTQ